MKKDLTQLSKARTVEECRSIASGMIESLGGMDRFVDLLGKVAFDNPGGASRWRVFAALFQLLRCVHTEEQKAVADEAVARRQLEDMTDGEAREVLRLLIGKNETLVANRLRDLGWRAWKPGDRSE